MRPRTFLVALVGSVALALGAVTPLACGSSSSSSAPAADPFVGTWSCSDTSTTAFTQPANVPLAMDSSTSVVTITDDGKGNLSALREPIDAGPPCTLKSTLNADDKSTTLIAGQACTTAGGATLTYTSGGATLEADGSRTTHSSWMFSGTTKTGAPLVGTGTGSGSCKKQ